MNNDFTADFFSGNREKLRELFPGTAPIVVTAAGLLQSSYDTAYPFEQDRDFWYLTGIEEPDVILVMDKQREYLIVPERNDYLDVFHGATDFGELSKTSGMATILDEKQGWKLLSGRLKRSGHVAVVSPPPEYIKTYGFYTNPARSFMLKKLKDINPELELLDLRSALVRLRMVKQPVEIAAIQKAIDLTIATFKALQKNSKKYKYEYEYVAEVTSRFIRGGSKHAYSPIVAFGERSCIMHNSVGHQPIAENEAVLMDIGAEFNHYAADITRVITPFGATKRQRQVIDAVCEAQSYAYSLLKPGLSREEYEKQMEHFVGEQLRKLGLIKTIESESVRRFFPHATSHMLGLDVHDSSDYDRPFEPNMVLTVEPGIYIPQEGIGVRIEDDVLITEDGVVVMSKKLPSVLE